MRHLSCLASQFTVTTKNSSPSWYLEVNGSTNKSIKLKIFNRKLKFHEIFFVFSFSRKSFIEAKMSRYGGDELRNNLSRFQDSLTTTLSNDIQNNELSR